MSWRDLFVVDDGADKSSAPSPAAAAPAPATAAAVPSTRVATQSAGDPAIVDRLMTAVNQSTSPGYPEFMRMLETLKEEESDDHKRYRLALRAVSANGITPAKIQQSLADRLRILDRERGKFAGNLQDQLDSRIGNIKSQLDTLRKDIAAKQEAIARLQDDLSGMNAQESSLQTKIDSENERLASVRTSFEASCDTVRKSLEADQNTISANLKGAK